jgi:hypothetical protein
MTTSIAGYALWAGQMSNTIIATGCIVNLVPARRVRLAGTIQQVQLYSSTFFLKKKVKHAGRKTPKWPFFGENLFIGPIDAARQELSNGPLFDLWG